MNVLEELLSSRWIVKSENKDKYYRVKDSLEEARRYANEKMGHQIIANSLLIKLEKIPAKAESYMGIEAFTSPMEYCFLCIILMFLEDREAEEQFVLSQLTEYVAANMTEEKADWTKYTTRKQLVKVMQFCIDNSILKINDGSNEMFANDYGGEVLYENTGVSKYFMRSFSRDILQFTNPSDFQASEWLDVNEDRGIARRHRIYKRLLMSTGIYRSGEADEDFEYLKNYGNRIHEDLMKNFDCRLQVHRSSAYLIMGEECHIGRAFPENSTLSDIILLCNRLLYQEILQNRQMASLDECCRLRRIEYERILLNCKEQYGKGFVKTYREMTATEFVNKVRDYMEHLAFIEMDMVQDEVIIRPIIGKIIGEYPKDFQAADGSKDEQQMGN